jgi:hypothetical protein
MIIVPDNEPLVNVLRIVSKIPQLTVLDIMGTEVIHMGTAKKTAVRDAATIFSEAVATAMAEAKKQGSHARNMGPPTPHHHHHHQHHQQHHQGHHHHSQQGHGRATPGQVITTVEVFDLESNEWKQLRLPGLATAQASLVLRQTPHGPGLIALLAAAAAAGMNPQPAQMNALMAAVGGAAARAAQAGGRGGRGGGRDGPAPAATAAGRGRGVGRSGGGHGPALLPPAPSTVLNNEITNNDNDDDNDPDDDADLDDEEVDAALTAFLNPHGEILALPRAQPRTETKTTSSSSSSSESKNGETKSSGDPMAGDSKRSSSPVPSSDTSPSSSSSASAATTTPPDDEPLHFPSLSGLGLSSCDDRLLSMINAPKLVRYRLFNSTVTNITDALILERFPKLSELRIQEATVVPSPILPTSSTPPVAPSSLVDGASSSSSSKSSSSEGDVMHSGLASDVTDLELSGGTTTPELITSMLLRCPNVKRLTIGGSNEDTLRALLSAPLHSLLSLEYRGGDDGTLFSDKFGRGIDTIVLLVASCPKLRSIRLLNHVVSDDARKALEKLLATRIAAGLQLIYVD